MSESENIDSNVNLPQSENIDKDVVADVKVESSEQINFSQTSIPSKKFPTLFVLLLVIIFSISVFVSFNNKPSVKDSVINQTNSPTPNPSNSITEVWQTYTNTKYGITVKLPSRWEITETPTPADDKWFSSNLAQFISPNATMSHGEINGGYYLTISVNKPTPNYSNLQEYLNFSSDQYKYVYTNKVINGINGYIFSLNGKESGYVTEKDGLFFIINWITDQEPVMFNQILSSFKFMSCTQNKALNISLELPKNWRCTGNIDRDDIGSLNLASDFFNVEISDGGRGPYCGDVPDPENLCKETVLQLSDKFQLTIFNYEGEDKELFGSLGKTSRDTNRWVSVKYANMETTSLTAQQKNELLNLYNAISFTN